MKKFYLFTIIIALLGISQVWANEAESANNSSDIVGGNLVISDKHVTFTLDGANDFGTGDKGYKLGNFGKGSYEYTLTWEPTGENYSISVSKISFWAKAYNWYVGNASSAKVRLADDDEVNIGEASLTNSDGDWAKLSKSSNFASGVKIVFRSTNPSFDFYLRYLKIEYTITPTVVPSVAVSDPQEVNVTIDLENKQTVNLKSLFAMPTGVPSDFAFGYEVSDGTVDGDNFFATVAGTYTVNAKIAAEPNCHEASALSEEAVTINVNRLNPTLTLTTNEAAVQVEKTLDLSALVVAHVGHALEYTVTSANKDKASLEGAMFSATEAGVYTVLIKSPQGDQYNETSQVVTVTVNAKPTPSFVRNFTQEEADAMLVEGTIENAFTLTNVSGDENLEITVVTKTISEIKKGDEVLSYDPESNTITALNAGTATIQFVQTETEEIGPASSEVFTFTVSKRDNTLYVKGEANYAGTICPDVVLENVVFTADNEDYENSPIGWSVFSGAEYAVFNEEAKTVTANYQIGTAIWTISQPENYKYNAGAGAFSVSVAYAAEEGEIFAYESGDNGGEGWNLGDFGEKWFDIDGTPLKVYFTAYTTELGDGWFETHAYVQPRQYYNNEWKDAGSKIEGSLATSFAETGNHDRDLNSGAKAITFTSGGKGTKYVSNVKVSCTSYLNVANITIDKQADETSVLVPETEGKATLVVRYGIANGGTLKLQCNNPDFKFTNEKLAANTTVIEIGGEEHKTGVIEIPVYYTATAPGNVNAEILVYNGVYNQTATITASVSKFTPVIINAPQAADIKIGQKLSDSELYGGEASVEGTFAWADDTIEPDSVKVHTYKVIFTPTDTENYNTVEIDVEVKVTGTETAVDNTASEVKATKILRNGQVLILRDGKVYNLNGQEVR